MYPRLRRRARGSNYGALLAAALRALRSSAQRCVLGRTLKTLQAADIRPRVCAAAAAAAARPTVPLFRPLLQADPHLPIDVLRLVLRALIGDEPQEAYRLLHHLQVRSRSAPLLLQRRRLARLC